MRRQITMKKLFVLFSLLVIASLALTACRGSEIGRLAG
jgi:hypothetical protein